MGKNPFRIKLRDGSQVHFRKGATVSGADSIEVDSDETSSITSDSTELLPTRQRAIRHSGIARSGVGWHPGLKDAFDPKKAAEQSRDLFRDPKNLFRRAHHHITDLDAKITAFAQDKPWSHVVEKDSDGITDLHKIKFTNRLSDEMPIILFEAANALRSVLDQVAFAIAVRHTGKAQPTSAKFPFSTTESKLLDHAKGACKDLPPEITALFVSFKPYRAGNNTLWALNALANTPKHKMLVPIIVGGEGLVISSEIVGSATIINPEWDSSTNEIVFLRAPPETKVRYNAQVAFSVALDEIEDVIRGQSPVTALRIMANEVESVLVAAEAESARLGLLR